MPRRANGPTGDTDFAGDDALVYDRLQPLGTDRVYGHGSLRVRVASTLPDQQLIVSRLRDAKFGHTQSPNNAPEKRGYQCQRLPSSTSEVRLAYSTQLSVL